MLQWPNQRQEEKESQYKRKKRERSEGSRAPKLACGFGSLQCAPALRRVTRREGGREKRTRNKKRRRGREGRNGRASGRRNEETASVSGQLKQRGIVCFFQALGSSCCRGQGHEPLSPCGHRWSKDRRARLFRRMSTPSGAGDRRDLDQMQLWPMGATVCHATS
jgi:hypothetical protein